MEAESWRTRTEAVLRAVSRGLAGAGLRLPAGGGESGRGASQGSRGGRAAASRRVGSWRRPRSPLSSPATRAPDSCSPGTSGAATRTPEANDQRCIGFSLQLGQWPASSWAKPGLRPGPTFFFIYSKLIFLLRPGPWPWLPGAQLRPWLRRRDRLSSAQLS